MEASAFVLQKRYAAGDLLATATTKGDLGQVVTACDLGVTDIARHYLGGGLLTEETFQENSPESRLLVADLRTQAHTPVTIIDQVDGTAPMSCFLPEWAVQAARVVAGKVTEAVIALPSLYTIRRPGRGPLPPEEERGLLLAARGEDLIWGSLQGGRQSGSILPFTPAPALPRENKPILHVGGTASTALYVTTDYRQGIYPYVTGSCAHDFTRLILGELDATLFAAKAWDLYPAWLFLQAAGFTLYRFPEYTPAPENTVQLFNSNMEATDLYIVARSEETARRVGKALVFTNRPFLGHLSRNRAV